MDKFKNAIVVTGCIGSGKSSVCEILKKKGYEVIDADKISHEILDSLGDEISAVFGSEFVKDSKPDRKKLGVLVFKDRKKLKILEQILHPKIKAEILRKAKILEKLNKVYFVDIPLFYESSNYPEFKRVLVVYAPKELIVERIMKRNLLTKDEALARINLQLDIEKKRDLADFVIENTRNLDELNSKVDEFLRGDL
ncbi:dephospho-CoA kinase [Campylobacter corcagiensis]|uniref:Dephospho-CoA kinase n=1 Tax=Campylobacter corcagiensis TaxID=1448857 RepID=A0A7M1LIS7_9BACT|nr:dephospho-CoA kinase [Campylobacter corcagiensis]QKF63943.1 dephospho-CoA kinase [Campylobacter corcagiensis]QOQ87854.1 dephospho-CoA kinase [Campylobacter corcagiensis]